MACRGAAIFIIIIFCTLCILWSLKRHAAKTRPVHEVTGEENKVRRCEFPFSDNASKDHHEFKHLTPLHSMQYLLSLNEASGKLCEAFRRDLFPTEMPVAAEERDFPLGFILTVYKSINQVARLLRLIYRPHNFYVIHVDKKTPQALYDAVQEIAKCFDANVGVVPRNDSVSVVWVEHRVLEQGFAATRQERQAVDCRRAFRRTVHPVGKIPEHFSDVECPLVVQQEFNEFPRKHNVD